jgi:HK97 family phage prohead protease
METTFVPLDAVEIRADDAGRHYIEGICVPYDRPTDRAGAIPEMFARGAFAELLASKARVKLTDYNHSMQRVPVGYSNAFEERSAGLWARFRLNRTPEGESARANAADGVYGGLSIGFIPRAEERRGGVRVITAARLDHVSLVEEPAYDEAEIIDVRSAGADLAEWRAIFAPLDLTIDDRPRMSQTLLMAHLRP